MRPQFNSEGERHDLRRSDQASTAAAELGLRELARRTRIDVATLSRLESGARAYPTAEQALRLARALGVTTDWLLGMYDEEMDSQQKPASMALASP